MPIIFISLNKEFIDLTKKAGFESYEMKVEDFRIRRRTYYMSPANSLGFMDGGIDLALSRKIMPGIEPIVKQAIKTFGKKTKLDRFYLPIGSSIIISHDDFKNLVVCPTMLLPQDISKTQNVLYATLACLYNILVNKGENLDDIDIILTSSGCGFGLMDSKASFDQTIKAINNYKNYNKIAQQVNSQVIIAEPNLNEQSKIYMNSEWINII